MARENERLKQKSIVSSMVRMMPPHPAAPPPCAPRLAEPSFFLLHLPGCLPYLCRDFRNCRISSRSVDKVEKNLKGSLDSIPSSSPSVKIQIMGVVNKLLKTKSLLTSSSNVLPLHLKQTFPPIF